MNINFRTQPDPLLSPRGSIKPELNEVKTSYFACRNKPHPRTVCHIKGLNDVPVCDVKDLDRISGHFIMPRIEQGQSTMHTKTSIGPTFPGTTTSNLQSLTSKRNNLPQPISHGTEKDIALLSTRTKNIPVLKRPSDLLRKYIPEQSQNTPLPYTRALSPTLALRYRPEIMEDMNYTLTYLDHEIKILEKLRDILQTDSLVEIKKWLSKASLNEKELVSNFIRSDITTRDLLNYHQKYGQSGREAPYLNLQAMLRGPKVIESTGEEKLLRNINQGLKGSIGTRSDRERVNLVNRGEKIIIPTCDSRPLEHFHSKSKERSPLGMPQTSSHLLRSYMRQRKYISGENVPSKKL